MEKYTNRPSVNYAYSDTIISTSTILGDVVSIGICGVFSPVRIIAVDGFHKTLDFITL